MLEARQMIRPCLNLHIEINNTPPAPGDTTNSKQVGSSGKNKLYCAGTEESWQIFQRPNVVSSICDVRNLLNRTMFVAKGYCCNKEIVNFCVRKVVCIIVSLIYFKCWWDYLIEVAHILVTFFFLQLLQLISYYLMRKNIVPWLLSNLEWTLI